MRDFIHKIAAHQLWSLAAAAVGLVVIAAIILYVVRIEHNISGQRERQRAEARVEVAEHVLSAPSTDGMTLFLNSFDVCAIASFRGVRYLATSGGLVRMA